MALTDQQLRENYYSAVIVYLCDYGSAAYTAADPSTGAPWAFTLVDLGPITPETPNPNPQISEWGVLGHAQPTSDELLATVTTAMIADCIAALSPSGEAPGSSLLRRLVAELSAKVASLEAKLAAQESAPPAEPAGIISPEPVWPTPAPRRDSDDAFAFEEISSIEAE
jgi:hypothetical protein